MADLLTRVRAEIDGRLGELRPLLSEYERLLATADALAVAGSNAKMPRRRGRRAPAPRATRRVSSAAAAGGALNRRGRAPRGAAEQAIVAALEHGSHTVSELAVVTAMSGPNIQGNLRRLLKKRTVTRAKRDGKAVYALSFAPGEA